MVGDGSYLMMNSDIYASVLSGHKMILVVCDNEGYAVMRTATNESGWCVVQQHAVRFRGNWNRRARQLRVRATSMGAVTFEVHSLAEFANALIKARQASSTAVIVTKVRAKDFTEGGAFWQVGVPEVSDRASVIAARASMDKGLKDQRPGVSVSPMVGHPNLSTKMMASVTDLSTIARTSHAVAQQS